MSKAGGRMQASDWFDPSKAVQKPVKVEYPDGYELITKRPGLPDTVYIGVNSKGQTVSIDKASYDQMKAKHGDKAKEIILAD